MHLIYTYRIRIIFLILSIGVAVYTLLSLFKPSQDDNLVFNNSNLILNQVNNTPFTGRIIDTLENRILIYEVKKGIKNGDFIVKYMNGHKAIEGKIVNNKNEGKWSYFYPSGKLESEGYFKNDISVEKWTWYYQNGKVKEEGIYIDGKRDGLWKLYNEKGEIKKSVFFNKGDLITSSDNKKQIAS